MADVIQLLPDSIANQIAAGEVIQRPASVVKELLENAVDAGSTKIQLIVKDAGKTLIQVVDDGCGMSETDARMAFERHATSKIRTVKDLFTIRTMGFRGEALASIASVAQVELRTRRQPDDLGTRLVIEASHLKVQEVCQVAVGTNFAVKNLFYNIPARRNFLKSNTVEMRHITEEFQRVAIANPSIFFSLVHNNTEVFHLQSGNLRQRLVGILGNASNKKLVPLTEETELVNINGFIGKPEFARKTRGEQFFFVNGRFIKSGLLHHAILGAYEDLLPKEQFPLYVIFIEINPKHVDINVHPTKQEIKFDDEKMVYNYLKVAVRHALGRYSVAPELDFEQDPLFARTRGVTTINTEATNFYDTRLESDVQTSTKTPYTLRASGMNRRERNNLKNWEKLYEGMGETAATSEQDASQVAPDATAPPAPVSFTIASEISQETSGGTLEMDDANHSFSTKQKKPYQLHNQYIVSQIKSGFLLIDQQAAHERILYERYLAQFQQKQVSTQAKLFPVNIELPTEDASLLRELLEVIRGLGFDIHEFGGNTFTIHGVPAELAEQEQEQWMIEKLLEQFKENMDLDLELWQNAASALACSAAISRGKHLEIEEMDILVAQLFACEMPFTSPRGRKCFVTFE
ncbi:MAG: DNA mismatch repair endonuclease MutL, partial [Bacteroidota bacterium]